MEYNKLLRRKRKALAEKNESLLCAACSDLADYYIKEEKFQEAIYEYQVLFKIYKEQKKMLDLATVNRGMGEAYMLLTDYTTAIKYQNKYLELSREQANKLEEQRALATLGYTYLTKYIGEKKDKNDLNLAYKYTMDSLEVCERLTDIKKFELVDMTSRLYNNLGIIQEYQGHHIKSMELFNKAIVLCKTNGVYGSLQQAYNSLATLFDRKGDYNRAIQNYNLAISVAKSLKNDTSALCDCLVSKSNILLKLGDIQAAKKSLQKAFKLKLSSTSKKEVEKKLKIVVSLYRTEKDLVSKPSSSTELQKCYETMGDGFSGLGCFERAIEFYKKMLEVAETTKNNLSSCYYSLAVTYRDDEQYDKAIEYFEKEYKLCDFKKGLDTLCEIADTKESSGCSYSEVIQVYERAITTCEEVDNLREKGRMLDRLITYLKRIQKLDLIPKYKERFDETGFVPSDSEESSQNANSEDDISLDNLTEDSDEEECDSPTGKRRPKTFQVRRNLKGETQLHTACIAGNTNVVRHLLEQGHPVNVRDNGGWLPLHDACISGHYDVVEVLLDKGAALNDRGGTHCKGITPLHDAAVNGHLKVMKLLLDRGASPLSKTDEGETPYHYLKKTFLETEFDEDDKLMCGELLERMGIILDKSGQSRDINTNIKNAAFVSSDGGDITEIRSRRINVSRTPIVGESRISYTRKISTSSESEEDVYGTESGMPEVVPKTRATNEYKMVMDNLRKKTCTEVPCASNKENFNSKRSAFVMSDAIIDDDWLEDDLGEKRLHKKRKIGDVDDYINSSNTRSTIPKSPNRPLKRYNSLETVSSKSSKASSKSKSKSPTKSIRRSNSNETINTSKSDRIDAMEDMANFNIDESDDDIVMESQTRKQQISLIDAGFIRYTTSSDLPVTRDRRSQKKSLQRKITRFGSTTPTKTSPAVSHRSSSSPKTSPSKSMVIDDDPILAIDVNIEGRPFRVTTKMSLKHTLTVKWLALEAASRYAKKEYVVPVLELTTKSGAELVDDDPIGTLFIHDVQVAEVNAKVLKWNLPLIRDRYKEACSDMATNVLESICRKLDTITISLDMKNNGIPSKSMAPLCKALLRENRLLELDLSNNFLSIDCIKYLVASLPTLENLTKLNLSCTNLHVDELRHLSNMFTNSPVNILTKLYSLDLSENFVQDECLQDIATITRYLNLKELNLSLLNFTTEVFQKSYNRSASFNLNSLEVLNLSGNNLGNEALQKFLSFVNPRHLTNLDLSHNKTSPGFTTSLINCLTQNGDKLNFEYLDLSRGSVEDSEVFNLLRSSENLKTVNLSYTEITSLSLRRLLETPLVKNITLLACENIDKYFDESNDLWSLVDHCSESKTLKLTCASEKFHILIKLWEEKYKKVVIQTEGNLLILK